MNILRAASTGDGTPSPSTSAGPGTLCGDATMKPKPSAGILLFRRGGRGLEVLLAHPGGPYWSRQDYGSWSVPKGIAEPDEAPEDVAAREFAEETGFDLANVAADPACERLDIGEVSLKSGKVIHAWAIEGDLDPALAHSNEVEIEWPPRSGRRQAIPEVDRVAWFDAEEARRRAHPAQATFVDRLEALLEA
jgi:predicted NUDIX family NTP pyrophosphohydrolase